MWAHPDDQVQIGDVVLSVSSLFFHLLLRRLEAFNHRQVYRHFRNLAGPGAQEALHVNFLRDSHGGLLPYSHGGRRDPSRYHKQDAPHNGAQLAGANARRLRSAIQRKVLHKVCQGRRALGLNLGEKPAL